MANLSAVWKELSRLDAAKKLEVIRAKRERAAKPRLSSPHLSRLAP
jgi:hypothetical protein